MKALRAMAELERGGECGIENYRTLCIPCHRKATKELAARRAAQRRNEKITTAKAVLSQPLRFGDRAPVHAAQRLAKLTTSAGHPKSES